MRERRGLGKLGNLFGWINESYSQSIVVCIGLHMLPWLHVHLYRTQHMFRYLDSLKTQREGETRFMAMLINFLGLTLDPRLPWLHTHMCSKSEAMRGLYETICPYCFIRTIYNIMTLLYSAICMHIRMHTH